MHKITSSSKISRKERAIRYDACGYYHTEKYLEDNALAEKEKKEKDDLKALELLALLGKKKE